MRTVLGAGVLVLALSLPACGETWIEVDKSAHHTTSIDKDSVERSGTHVKFWLRTVFDAEHPIGIYGGKEIKGENVQGTTHFVESRSLADVDCVARTSTNPQVKFMDASGNVMSEAVGLMEPKPFGPNAIVAPGADMFCPKP